MPDDSEVGNQSPSEMPHLTGDFDRKTRTPLFGSGEPITGIIQFSDMNDSRVGNQLPSEIQDLPVSEIAIVSMVSMLFPWHFSGIIWHPGGIHGIWYSDKISEWKAVEIHGIWPTKWLPTPLNSEHRSPIALP